MLGRAGLVFDPFHPRLAPERINLARAEPATRRSLAGADRAFEDQAVFRKLEHAPIRVLDDAFHPVLDPERLATIGQHLAVEREPTILPLVVERLPDRLGAPNPHE